MQFSIGQISEMLFPTLLLFAISYTAAKNSLKLKDGALRIAGLFGLAWLCSGILNILLYEVVSNRVYGSFVFLGISFVISLAVVLLLGKRASRPRVDGAAS